MTIYKTIYKSYPNAAAKAMEKGISIDALLFGHNHQGEERNGTWGIKRWYDAGSATCKPRPKYIKFEGFKTLNPDG